MIRKMKLFAAVAVAAALSFSIPVAARADDDNRHLAKGAVTESVSGGNWNILFDIQTRGTRHSPQVMVANASETFSFDGSLCAGTYTDPRFGGTTVYVVGQQTSYTGPGGGDNDPYYAFKVHKSGPLSADYSWVDVPITSLAAAQNVCGNPATALSAAYFSLVASYVNWGGGDH
jgi:hypothetical protein